MKNWWLVALGIVLGLLSAGVILLSGAPPRGKPIALLPPPSPIPIQVHVIGAVQHPGVYALSPGSRVQDAIEISGGFTIDANKSTLNLASYLEDGIRIEVPFQILTSSPEKPITSTDGTALVQTTPSPSDSQIRLININSADQTMLETLSGIGPVIASKIITFREENGPFSNIVEIQKVSGIGPATFEKIKAYITVDEQP